MNQSFTCEAGRTIWGFPKTVDEIDFDTSGDRARCVWNKDGQNVLKISFPIGGNRDFPEQELCTYSYIDGTLHRTPFISSAENLGVRAGGVKMALGAHPIADKLRSLGASKARVDEPMDGKDEGPVRRRRELYLRQRGRNPWTFAQQLLTRRANRYR